MEIEHLHDDGTGQATGKGFVYLNGFLAMVCQLTRRDGFVTKAMSQNVGIAATGDRAWEIMMDPSAFVAMLAARTDADVGTAEDIMAYVRTELANAAEPYLVRLHQEMQSPHVTRQNAALIASAYKVYTDACGTGGVSEHIGKQGEKRFFRLAYKGKSRLGQKQNGLPSYLYTFVEGGQNIVKWFSTTDHEFVPNCTYAIAATVTSHTVYRNEKETRISNGAVAGIVI